MNYKYAVVHPDDYSDPILVDSLIEAREAAEEMLEEGVESVDIYSLTPYGVATLKTTVVVKRV
jgi:hypothetical protein